MKAAKLWVEAAAFRVKTAALRVNAAALGVKTATMMVSAAAIFSEKTASRVRATEQSLHSENKDRDIRLFSIAFGGSIPMKLPMNLLSLPCIPTYLRTSRKAWGKRISVAQARRQEKKKSGHANGPRVTVTLLREERKRAPVFFFCVFDAGMRMFSQAISSHSEVFTCISVHPERLSARRF